jgi:hypothetical protein
MKGKSSLYLIHGLLGGSKTTVVIVPYRALVTQIATTASKHVSVTVWPDDRPASVLVVSVEDIESPALIGKMSLQSKLIE